jgi:hypothetical protein
VVVDRYGRPVAADDAFALVTEGADAGLLGPEPNLFRLALHPGGLAPRIANFDDWAQHVVSGLRREADHRPDERPAALCAGLAGYAPARRPSAPGTLGFAVPMELRSRHGLLRLITTVTTVTTAADVTPAELEPGAFLPADRATAAVLTGLRDTPGH